jgi:hypothetical protein
LRQCVYDVVVYVRRSANIRQVNINGFVVCHADSILRLNYNVKVMTLGNGG